jgi:GTPase SAR1 family protein
MSLSQSGLASRYTRRVGRVTHNENSPDCPLHVLEVEASICNLDNSDSKGPFWPEGAPRVDGVLICYDASDEESFTPVENLLKGYRALKLPTVVLACKSDLVRQVEPQQALELLQQYDVGLVEVTNGEDAGKAKMRRSFDWILKAIFRERSCPLCSHLFLNYSDLAFRDEPNRS